MCVLCARVFCVYVCVGLLISSYVVAEMPDSHEMR